LAARTRGIVERGDVPLVLGGHHSIAAGSVAGVAAARAAAGERSGLLWLDAHSDLHLPETSESGNIHGMPLAHILGRGHSPLAHVATEGPAVLPQHVAIIGARDLDPGERVHAREWVVRVYTMREVDERGMR